MITKKVPALLEQLAAFKTNLYQRDFLLTWRQSDADLRAVLLIAETLDADKTDIKDNVSLYDCLGVDSTEMVELNVALQKKFGVRFAQNEISNRCTLADIVRIIQSKKSA